MNDIRDHIRDLSWYKSEEVQRQAILRLEHIKDEDIILLARQDNELCSKDCWENAAIVLRHIGYPRINSVIPYLMEWFMDLNWPGVPTIIEIFRSIDVNALTPYIEEAMEKAVKEGDYMWCYWLGYMARELNVEETNFVNTEVYKRLKEIIKNLEDLE